MCGIIGYVGDRPCRELILTGLERLEYRGYDSAGFALLDGTGGFAESVRAVGNLAELRAAAGPNGGSPATTGLGHTRWATHGRVTEANAHPHASADGSVLVVMNGIIENYLELRSELQDAGRRLRLARPTPRSSRTSSPAPTAATWPRPCARCCRGSRATSPSSPLTSTSPGGWWPRARSARWWSASGDGERFVASAIPAFLRETRDVDR